MFKTLLLLISTNKEYGTYVKFIKSLKGVDSL